MGDFPVSERMEIQSHIGSYTVEFGEKYIEVFSEWDFDKTHSIVDRKVAQLYPEQLQPILESSSVLLQDALERNKSLEILPEYVEFLVEKKIAEIIHSSLLVAESFRTSPVF